MYQVAKAETALDIYVASDFEKIADMIYLDKYNECFFLLLIKMVTF